VGDPPRCHSCPSNGPGRAPLLPLWRCRCDGKISGCIMGCIMDSIVDSIIGIKISGCIGLWDDLLSPMDLFLDPLDFIIVRISNIHWR